METRQTRQTKQMTRMTDSNDISNEWNGNGEITDGGWRQATQNEWKRRVKRRYETETKRKTKKKKPHLFQFDAAFFPFTPLDADSMLFADLNTGVFSLTVGCCVECCSCVYGGPRREIDGVRIKIRIRAKWGMNA